MLGADFLTVHAEPDVLKGAVAGRGDDKRLKILAVTVLTSLTQESLTRSGVSIKLEDLVLRRAEFAAKAIGLSAKGDSQGLTQVDNLVQLL